MRYAEGKITRLKKRLWPKQGLYITEKEKGGISLPDPRNLNDTDIVPHIFQRYKI